MKASSNNITELKPNEVFVFGDNEGGIHGKGAAKLALNKFGAKWGKVGHYGQSYGIPTKTGNLKTLGTRKIAKYVDDFIAYAIKRHDLDFLVTEIGCGLAGYEPKDIAPLFKEAQYVSNIYLPQSFINILEV